MDRHAAERILGVRPMAGPHEIRAAWRRAAARWHPDLRGGADAGATERLQNINAARDVLLGPRGGAAASAAPPTRIPEDVERAVLRAFGVPSSALSGAGDLFGVTGGAGLHRPPQARPGQELSNRAGRS